MGRRPRRLSRGNRQNSGSKVFFGVALIAVGILFALQRSGVIANAWDVLRYWPAVLIVLGLRHLGSSPIGGTVIAVVGAWLLAEQLDFLDVSFWEWMWPLILVGVGSRIVWQGLRGQRSTTDASSVSLMAALGGATRTCNTPNFQGGDLIAFMGGCELDLRHAQISESPAVIDAFAFWGGIEIRVPETWTVSVEGIPLLGGYEDNTRQVRPSAGASEDGTGLDPSRGPDESIEDELERAIWGGGSVDTLIDSEQHLVVKGFAIMGGVEVRN